MKILSVLFIFWIPIILSDERVKFSAVIFRHGDRTPIEPYPTDPYKNESLWPVKFGELTNIGKRQHYALGQWLRRRYSHLLSVKFDPAEIYVRSTDMDRTLMSAQSNLAGMYPPSGTDVWNKDLMWQPIPIHTVPEKEDVIMAIAKDCPVYDNEYQRYTNSKPYKDKLSHYQRLMNYLTASTGTTVKDLRGIEYIYSNLYIEDLYNFTLPNWTKIVYPERLREPACSSFKVPTTTPLMARLKVGPIMDHILKKMTTAANSTDGKYLKVMVFSAHDDTIGHVLNALGLFDNKCPVYTATILMELLFDDVSLTHAIRISYRNSTEIVEPYVLTIPHCGTVCPLSRFKTLYKNLLNVNWEKECRSQFSHLLGVCFMMGIGIIILVYAIHKLQFNRVSRRSEDHITFSQVVHFGPSKVTAL